MLCRCAQASQSGAAATPWLKRLVCGRQASKRAGPTTAGASSSSGGGGGGGGADTRPAGPAQQQHISSGSKSSRSSSSSSSPGEGPTVVQVSYRGQSLRAERGSTLRTALLTAGATPHNGRATLINCRGLGTCGTCTVEIRGAVEPAQWTAAEQLRLNFPPHSAPGNARLRLACQVACEGDLRVVKRRGFWGQGVEVLPDLPASSSSSSSDSLSDAAGSGDGAPGAAGEDAAAAAAAAKVMPLGQLELVLDWRRRRRAIEQQEQQQ